MSGFPERGVDFWGGPGNFRESLGIVRETSRLLLNSTVREVAQELPGKFRVIRGSPGTFQKLRGA